MSTPARRWKDSKDRESITTGKWTQKEIDHLKRLLCKYAARKNLTPEQLGSLCSDTTPEEFKNVWTKIARYFPDRSVQSVHNCCKRSFNPYNYKGEWTVLEERALIEYVETNGKKWKELGEILQRTANNVKDKWKQMGGDRHELRKTGTWGVEETLELVRLIFMNLSLPWLKAEKFNKENDDTLMDSILKLIEKYKSKITKAEINWEAISEMFKTRSSVDCRTRWSYILNYKIPERVLVNFPMTQFEFF